MENQPKFYRVYYNRSEDYPCIWSIDEGTTGSEIRVQWVSMETSCRTNTNLGPQKPYETEHDENEPASWVYAYGFVEFRNGGVVIKEKP